MVSINTDRIGNETLTQYLWRIGSNREILNLTWTDVANLCNKYFQDEDTTLTESAYRKKYQAAKQFYDEVFIKEDFKAEDVEETKRELFKLKQQLRDERTGLNTKLRAEARLEQDLDYLKDKLQEIGRVNFEVKSPHISVSKKSIIACLADLHAGQTFDSSFGKYDTDILRDRMNQYLNKIIEIAKLYSCDSIYLMCLGDELSGLIHDTVRITNRENVIDQLKIAAELIASLCVECSKVFNHVYLASVAGNHSRLFQSKDESLKNENLDLLCTWIVKQMTNHIENITVLDNQIDSTISSIEVYGKTYLGVHGDMDSMNDSSIGRLVMAVGEIPYAILCGHRHSPAYRTFNGIHFLQSGSFASAGDDYTISKRLTGSASQTVLVVDENGIQNITNVELN